MAPSHLHLRGWAQSQKELSGSRPSGEGPRRRHRGQGSRPPSLCASPLTSANDRSASLQTPRRHFHLVELPPAPGLGVSPAASPVRLPASASPPARHQPVNTALWVPHAQCDGSRGALLIQSLLCPSLPASTVPHPRASQRPPDSGQHRHPSPSGSGAATSAWAARVLSALPGQARPCRLCLPRLLAHGGCPASAALDHHHCQSLTFLQDTGRRQVLCDHSGAAGEGQSHQGTFRAGAG